MVDIESWKFWALVTGSLSIVTIAIFAVTLQFHLRFLGGLSVFFSFAFGLTTLLLGITGYKKNGSKDLAIAAIVIGLASTIIFPLGLLLKVVF